MDETVVGSPPIRAADSSRRSTSTPIPAAARLTSPPCCRGVMRDTTAPPWRSTRPPGAARDARWSSDSDVHRTLPESSASTAEAGRQDFIATGAGVELPRENGDVRDGSVTGVVHLTLCYQLAGGVSWRRLGSSSGGANPSLGVRRRAWRCSPK